jgi:hypothetical protein
VIESINLLPLTVCSGGKFQAPPKVANSFPGKENVGKENTEQTKHIFLSCIFFSRKTVSWRMKLAALTR